MVEGKRLPYTPPDGGHGWLIVAASSLTYALSGGIFYAQGILYPEFVKTFDAGEAPTAWICSILTGLCMLSAMVGGLFLEVVGYRVLCVVGSFMAGVGFIVSGFVNSFAVFFFTYSITVGIGLGIQFVAAVMIPQLYFEKKRSIATGITVSGAPLGGFLMTPLVQFFIDTYGWRATMLLIGAITLNGCSFGIVMVPPKNYKSVPEPPDPKELEPPEPRPLARLRVDMGSAMMHSIENMRSVLSLEVGEDDLNAETKLQRYIKRLSKIFDFSVLKQGIVLIVLANWFLFSMGYMVPYVFLPLYTAQYNIDTTTTARIISASGITDFLGRLIVGVVGNCECISSVHLFGATSIVTGLSCVLSQFATTAMAFYAFALVYGFFVGGWLCISTVCLAELLGVENLAKSFGIMQLAGSLAFFTTSPLHALMLEATKSVATPFISAGVMHIFAGLLFFLYYYTCYKKRHINKEYTLEDLAHDADSIDDKNFGPKIVITLPSELTTDEHKDTDTLHSEVAIVA